MTEIRSAPHNLEAERSVLGAILLQNDTIYRVFEAGLEARDFYKEAHNKVFDVATSLAQKAEAIDIVTLTAGLKNRGWFDDIGGTATLTSLLEDPFAPSNISHYAKIVREKALIRRMIQAAGDIMQAGYEPVESVPGFLDECERRVFEVANIKKTDSFSSMKEIVQDAMRTIDELAQNKEPIVGLPTGLIEFDNMTGGLHPGQLIVVAGRPGMGKTSFFLSMVQHAAVARDAVIAIFSLEMTREELFFRLVSGQTRLNSNKLRLGRIGERDWPKLIQAADQMARQRVFIEDSGSVTPMDIRARCRRIMASEKRLDLVVVDYLQLMSAHKMGSRTENRVQEVSEISRNLKMLAKELKVPVIALSQLSRNVESRPDKRPMQSDLRESGAIEQDADIICFIYRDEVYNPNTDDKGIAELIVSKFRGGTPGTVRLAWLPEFTLFANLAESGGSPMGFPRSDRDGDVSL